MERLIALVLGGCLSCLTIACFDEPLLDLEDAEEICTRNMAVGTWLRCSEPGTWPTVGCETLDAEGFVLQRDGAWHAINAAGSRIPAQDAREYCDRAEPALRGTWTFAEGRVKLQPAREALGELHFACLLDQLSGVLPADGSPETVQRSVSYARADATSLGQCRADATSCEHAAQCAAARCEAGRCGQSVGASD